MHGCYFLIILQEQVQFPINMILVEANANKKKTYAMKDACTHNIVINSKLSSIFIVIYIHTYKNCKKNVVRIFLLSYIMNADRWSVVSFVQILLLEFIYEYDWMTQATYCFLWQFVLSLWHCWRSSLP